MSSGCLCCVWRLRLLLFACWSWSHAPQMSTHSSGLRLRVTAAQLLPVTCFLTLLPNRCLAHCSTPFAEV
jgi:hypothetical protein